MQTSTAGATGVAVTARVPATTANLGPGFDAFGLALACELVVRAVPGGDGPRVTTRGEGAGEVTEGDDNLVWRSLERLCVEQGVEPPPVRLEVVNAIPLERGLGSSSAAIVAGLVLGRALCDVRVGDRQLVELATEIEGHPDNVAPALLGGLVACARDDDGSLVVRRRNPAPGLRPVAFVPQARQATTAARAVLPATLPRAQVAEQAARAGHVLAGLLGAWPVAAGAAGDRLHEPARLEVMTATGAVLAALRERGLHAFLSGAGPTAVCLLDGTAGVELAELEAIGRAHDVTVRSLRPDLRGAFACADGGCALSGVQRTCAHCPRQGL
ncbi:homoserine kinase [Egicoccus halophilus]|uniref:Homoserine kinase n=1 Tax=Egicoccus halophilus TaxID=1670830 RepID=A0A8J3EWM2_9ACTN|nr:homoserine kinase [Egicoccus halophilus]GGI03982.1 homoserine kinase [Egicoccus halophilus]